jgi:hypothetical protein
MTNKAIFLARLVLLLLYFCVISGVVSLVTYQVTSSKGAAIAFFMLFFSFLCMGAYDDNDGSCAFENLLPKYKTE